MFLKLFKTPRNGFYGCFVNENHRPIAYTNLSDDMLKVIKDNKLTDTYGENGGIRIILEENCQHHENLDDDFGDFI